MSLFSTNACSVSAIFFKCQRESLKKSGCTALQYSQNDSLAFLILISFAISSFCHISLRCSSVSCLLDLFLLISPHLLLVVIEWLLSTGCCGVIHRLVK